MLFIFLFLFSPKAFADFDTYIFREQCVPYALSKGWVVKTQNSRGEPTSLYTEEDASVLRKENKNQSIYFDWKKLENAHRDAIASISDALIDIENSHPFKAKSKKTSLRKYVDHCIAFGKCDEDFFDINLEEHKDWFCPTHVYDHARNHMIRVWNQLLRDCLDPALRQELNNVTYKDAYPNRCSYGFSQDLSGKTGFEKTVEFQEQLYEKFLNPLEPYVKANQGDVLGEQKNGHDALVRFAFVKIHERLGVEEQKLQKQDKHDSAVHAIYQNMDILESCGSSLFTYDKNTKATHRNTVDEYGVQVRKLQHPELAYQGIQFFGAERPMSSVGLPYTYDTVSGSSRFSLPHQNDTPKQTSITISPLHMMFLNQGDIDYTKNNFDYPEILGRVEHDEYKRIVASRNTSILENEASRRFEEKLKKEGKPLQREMFKQGFAFAFLEAFPFLMDQLMASLSQESLDDAMSSKEGFKHVTYQLLNSAIKMYPLESKGYWIEQTQKYIKANQESSEEGQLDKAIEVYRRSLVNKSKVIRHNSEFVDKLFLDQFNNELNELNSFCQASKGKYNFKKLKKDSDYQAKYKKEVNAFSQKLYKDIQAVFVKHDLAHFFGSENFQKYVVLQDPDPPFLGKHRDFAQRCVEDGTLFSREYWTGTSSLQFFKVKDSSVNSFEMRQAIRDIKVAAVDRFVELIASSYVDEFDEKKVQNVLIRRLREHAPSQVKWLLSKRNLKSFHGLQVCSLLNELTSDEKFRQTLLEVSLWAGTVAAGALMASGIGSPIGILMEWGIIALTAMDTGIFLWEASSIQEEKERMYRAVTASAKNPWNMLLYENAFAHEKRMQYFGATLSAALFFGFDARMIIANKGALKSQWNYLTSSSKRQVAKERIEELETLVRRGHHSGVLDSAYVVSRLKDLDLIDNALYAKIRKKIKKGMSTDELKALYPQLFPKPSAVSQLTKPVRQATSSVSNAIGTVPWIYRARLAWNLKMHGFVGRYLDYYPRIAEMINTGMNTFKRNGEPLISNAQAENLVDQINGAIRKSDMPTEEIVEKGITKRDPLVYYVKDAETNRVRVVLARERDKTELIAGFFQKYKFTKMFENDLTSLFNGILLPYNELHRMLVSISRKLDDPDWVRRVLGGYNDAGKIVVAREPHMKALKQVVEYAKMDRGYSWFRGATRRTDQILDDAGDLWEIAIWNFQQERSHITYRFHMIDPKQFEGGISESLLKNKDGFLKWRGDVKAKYEKYYRKEIEKIKNADDIKVEAARQRAIHRTSLWKNTYMYCRVPYSKIRKSSNARFKKYYTQITLGVTALAYFRQRKHDEKDLQFYKILAFDSFFSAYGAKLKSGAFAAEGRPAITKLALDWLAGRQVGVYEAVGHGLTFGFKGTSSEDKVLDDYLWRMSQQQEVDEEAVFHAFDEYQDEIRVLRKELEAQGKEIPKLEDYLKENPELKAELDQFIDDVFNAETDEELDRILIGEDVKEYDPELHGEILDGIADALYEERHDNAPLDYGVPDTGTAFGDRFAFFMEFDAARAIPSYWVSFMIYRMLCKHRNNQAAAFSGMAMTMIAYKYLEKHLQYLLRDQTGVDPD